MPSGTMLIRFTIDAIFSPPLDYGTNKKTIHDFFGENRYELVFEEGIDSKQICAAEDKVIIEMEENDNDDDTHSDNEKDTDIQN